MKWATVLLAVPFESEFTYCIPDNLCDKAFFGRRAVVPFGARETTGFIVSVFDEKPETDYEIKEIKRIPDKVEVFNKDLLETARWMSGMYL
ncbi:MAG: primosomal protein N', partial [Spirochaetales bacterium]|nr:primosomal protein N' [Candidatus Physcosoma equi]